ncbi:MAG: S1C family serine protease [Anaerolineae bacterium]|nr:S1C family serine protease [Anaerolineae bacterium]
MSILEQVNERLSSLAAEARRSLVRILSGRAWRQGSGSGTIWHSDGLIVTNAHVVERSALRVVLHDGRELAAELIAADKHLDLAALRIEASGLPTVVLGNSKQLRVGSWVFALGFPYGVDSGLTGGVVIGSGADLPEMPANGREWLALSLHLRPGHSGGMLLDAAGKLIGINTLITGPDVGFAIPVHVVKRFLKAQLGVTEAPSRTARPDSVVIL